MSAATQISLIVDDTNTQYLQFSPDASVSPTGPIPSFAFYGSTAHMTGPGTDAPNATFVTIVFDGTSVSLYGNTSQEPERFTVSIDGSETFPYEYLGPAGYGPFFDMEPLADGHHNITLSNVVETSIDFAVITVNMSTSLASQQPVIVDDSERDSSETITYTGAGWSISGTTSSFYQILDSLPSTSAIPYMESTHETNGVGDTLNFTFAGNQLVVYGIMDLTAPSSLNLRFTVDGGSQEDKNYVVMESDVVEFQGLKRPNFPWYQTPSNLPTGEHTLGVEVLDCQNLTFVVDYFTFMPFSVSISPAAGAGSSSRKGAIAGGVVGGVVFVILVGLLFDCIRRRKRQIRTRFLYPFRRGIQSGIEIPLDPMYREGIINTNTNSA